VPLRSVCGELKGELERKNAHFKSQVQCVK